MKKPLDVREGDNLVLVITEADLPPAEARPAPSAPTPPTPVAAASTPLSSGPPPSTGGGLGGQKIGGLIAGGAGVVGVVIGAVFGLSSKSKHDASLLNCHAALCNADGVTERNDARSAGNVSTGAFIVGGLGIAGGLALWFTAPTPDGGQTAGVGLAPEIGRDRQGLILKGTW
jgi:hypothetical protein